jgi:hypothetical protein
MTFHDRGTSWFLAQLKPNCANIADKNLKRQGFQTFLPMEEETRQRNGKFVTAMRPFFPGYIFVTFDVATVLGCHWMRPSTLQARLTVAENGLPRKRRLAFFAPTQCSRRDVFGQGSVMVYPMPFAPRPLHQGGCQRHRGSSHPAARGHIMRPAFQGQAPQQADRGPDLSGRRTLRPLMR